MQDLPATVRGARPRMRAAEIIGRRIVSGGLLPGTVLPDFDELAAELSVTRVSVREAIRELADKGLVSSSPSRGTVVRPPSEWSRHDLDVLVWRIPDVPDAAFIDNLFEVRRLIEPEAAAIVATRATRETIAGMEQALATMASAGPQTSESIDADLSFHKLLLIGTGNTFIAGFAPLMETLLRAIFRVQRDIGPDSAKLVHGHRIVLEAIKRGDADGARRGMLATLEWGEEDAMDGIRPLAPTISRVAAGSMT